MGPSKVTVHEVRGLRDRTVTETSGALPPSTTPCSEVGRDLEVFS